MWIGSPVRVMLGTNDCSAVGFSPQSVYSEDWALIISVASDKADWLFQATALSTIAL